MTFEQLRIFMAVAEREHVTRAARALDLTQSSVSAAVASLEREFGTKLFHRVGRGIALTEAGRLFLDETRSILARADAASALMRDVVGLARGRLSIKASQTIASHVLPSALVGFHRTYPGIVLAVSLGNSSDVARAVLDGSVELGFVEGPASALASPQLAAELIGHDELALIVPPGHPWSGKTDLGAAELAAGTWVLREDGSGTRAVFIDAMAGLGVKAASLDIAIELPSNEAVLAAVAAGAGAAILSLSVCADGIATGRIARVPLALERRAYYAVQHAERTRSRAVAALLAILRRPQPGVIDRPARERSAGAPSGGERSSGTGVAMDGRLAGGITAPRARS